MPGPKANAILRIVFVGDPDWSSTEHSADSIGASSAAALVWTVHSEEEKNDDVNNNKSAATMPAGQARIAISNRRTLSFMNVCLVVLTRLQLSCGVYAVGAMEHKRR